MVLNIPEEYVRATRLTEQELLVEIAVLFFQKGKLTMGQAAKLAELSQYQFQWILAGRDIPIHYDLEDYNEDLETINTLKL